MTVWGVWLSREWEDREADSLLGWRLYRSREAALNALMKYVERVRRRDGRKAKDVSAVWPGTDPPVYSVRYETGGDYTVSLWIRAFEVVA